MCKGRKVRYGIKKFLKICHVRSKRDDIQSSVVGRCFAKSLATYELDLQIARQIQLKPK